MHVDHVTFVVVVNSYVACRSYFFFFLMIQRTPISTLFPYTTLFRSIVEMDEGEAGAMNKPVHLRELKIREANRRIRQADRKSTRLNSSHLGISYAVFCLKKKIEMLHEIRQSVSLCKERRYRNCAQHT